MKNAGRSRIPLSNADAFIRGCAAVRRKCEPGWTSTIYTIVFALDGLTGCPFCR
jgi:hypothetical protein